MAGKFSVTMANKVLSKTLRGVDFAVPANMWVALFRTADATPLRNDNIAAAMEVSGGGYTRLKVRGTGAVAVFDVPANGVTQLPSVISWPSATGAWGSVYFMALVDAETDGSIVLYSPLSTPKVIDIGDVARFPSGLLSIGL